MTYLNRPIFLILICFIFSLCVSLTAHGARKITGTVIEKRADSVKVEFKPHNTAVPNIGDRVDFKKLFKGYEASAGHGEVTESGAGFVWVKTGDNRPNLEMIGVIQATGILSAVPKGRLDRTIDTDRVPLKKPRRVREPSGKSMSQQDLKNAVTQELIRLRYISPKSSGNLSADELQPAIDMCGLDHGFPTGRIISEELLNYLQTLEP